jgi:hypothetical protein
MRGVVDNVEANQEGIHPCDLAEKKQVSKPVRVLVRTGRPVDVKACLEPFLSLLQACFDLFP